MRQRRGYSIYYCHSRDHRNYSEKVWKPGILDKIVEGKNLKEARERVTTHNGKYSYVPSREYRQFLSKKIKFVHNGNHK